MVAATTKGAMKRRPMQLHERDYGCTSARSLHEAVSWQRRSRLSRSPFKRKGFRQNGLQSFDQLTCVRPLPSALTGEAVKGPLEDLRFIQRVALHRTDLGVSPGVINSKISADFTAGATHLFVCGLQLKAATRHICAIVRRPAWRSNRIANSGFWLRRPWVCFNTPLIWTLTHLPQLSRSKPSQLNVEENGL